MNTRPRAGSMAAMATLAMLTLAPSWLASQAPPVGARFLCKDGTYSTAATASAACTKHQGVAKTLASPATPAPTASAPAQAPVAHVPAPAPRPAPAERGALGLGVGYASYKTSYWFYGGGASAWHAWSQVQVSGFYESGMPLRLGDLQTRLRLEVHIGTGGASNDAGSGYVGNGSSLTNGSLSGGLAATLRLPLNANPSAGARPYVGLGLDFVDLWGFGDNSQTMYGKGWNERVLTVPLVAGVAIQTPHLILRPEIRYAFIGSTSTNLYLSGAGTGMEDKGPAMLGFFVAVTGR